jgi:hypothetical protein
VNVFHRLVDGKRKRLTRHDAGGEGWEIAAEAYFCPECARDRDGSGSVEQGSRVQEIDTQKLVLRGNRDPT